MRSVNTTVMENSVNRAMPKSSSWSSSTVATMLDDVLILIRLHPPANAYVSVVIFHVYISAASVFTICSTWWIWMPKELHLAEIKEVPHIRTFWYQWVKEESMDIGRGLWKLESLSWLMWTRLRCDCTVKSTNERVELKRQTRILWDAWEATSADRSCPHKPKPGRLPHNFHVDISRQLGKMTSARLIVWRRGV